MGCQIPLSQIESEDFIADFSLDGRSRPFHTPVFRRELLILSLYMILLVTMYERGHLVTS